MAQMTLAPVTTALGYNGDGAQQQDQYNNKKHTFPSSDFS